MVRGYRVEFQPTDETRRIEELLAQFYRWAVDNGIATDWKSWPRKGWLMAQRKETNFSESGVYSTTLSASLVLTTSGSYKILTDISGYPNLGWFTATEVEVQIQRHADAAGLLWPKFKSAP